MLSFIRVVLVVCLSFVSMLSAEEHLSFSFDQRKWQLDFEDSIDETHILEFALEGETVNNWSELVVVLSFSFPENSVSVEQFYQDFKDKAEQFFDGHPFINRLIEKDENSLVYEWGVHDQSPFAQHEWCKIIKTPNKWYILSYTTKKINEVEQVRATWEKIVLDAHVSS